MLGVAGMRRSPSARDVARRFGRRRNARALGLPRLRAAARRAPGAPASAPPACARPACRAARYRERRAGRGARASRTKSSVSANSASVSVGKPAIRSAPIAIPGRSARARSITASASRAQMAPPHALQDQIAPACSDRCRCGISRGSSAISRHRSSSIAAGSIEDSRSRGNSGTAPAAGGPSGPASARPAGPGHRRRYRRRSARSPG